MEFAGLPPSKWLVTFTDGSVMELWADAYSEDDGAHVFSVLVDATEAEQEDLDVIGRAPLRPERVMIAVARVPSGMVRSVFSG